MTELSDLLEKGKIHHRAGRLDEAQACYRKALSMGPDHADALHLSGVLAFHRGRLSTAIPLLEKAVEQEPFNPQYLGNLGAVQLADGEVVGALAALEKAVSIDDSAVDLLSNYGAALREAGRIEDSCTILSRAQDLAPNDGPLLVSLGASFLRADENEAALQQADAALGIKSDDGEALNLKGAALMALERREEALSALQAAVAAAPEFADAARNLGLCLQSVRRYQEAEDCYRKATALWPGDAAAHAGLARTFRVSGQSRAAIDSYRTALALAPDNMRYHSRFLFTLLCDDRVSPQVLIDEHRKWGERHVSAASAPFNNDRDLSRKLRVGFVSADFGNHPVGRIFLPVVKARNQDAIAAFCYNNGSRDDEITASIRGTVKNWRDIAGLSDEDVLALIRNDEIDILVDLSGHSAGHRLTVFGARAAPVQASWLGYMSTTGVPAMDAIIADGAHAPAGSDDEFGEQVMRLERDLACFEPIEGAPDIASSPISENGFVTFGAFCNPGKVSPSAVALWSQVMSALPESRLHLRYDGFQDAALQARFIAMFAAHDITADRVSFTGSVASYADVLAAYGEIDVAFDTHPYSGTMTTFEALWMGVPVLALAGDRMVARQAAAHLTAAGLEEMIAVDEEDFVARAVALANDPTRLADLRLTLRDQLRSSDLCDADGLARGLEKVWRTLWQDFCKSAGPV